MNEIRIMLAGRLTEKRVFIAFQNILGAKELKADMAPDRSV